MNLSPAGLALLKKSEGFRSAVYKDYCGYPTIGYGHRLTAGESFPRGVTQAQAVQIMVADVFSAESVVKKLVQVPLTQGIFDALTDFVFNLGGGRLAGSTLRNLLNAGQYDAAAEELRKWDHGHKDGHLVEVQALKERRNSEYLLWHGGSPDIA